MVSLVSNRRPGSGNSDCLITESGIENVGLDPNAIYVNIRFTPVNLYGIASGKRQRHINVLAASTQYSDSSADV